MDPQLTNLDARYPLTDVAVSVAGRVFHLVAVRDQDALVDRVRTEADLAVFPFGLMLWPAALALADALPAILTRLGTSHPPRVLEIGAGVGLAGFAAAHAGAIVTQTDYHEDALILCRYNAARNHIAPVIRSGDWRDFPHDLTGFDLVIGSDVLYERSLHNTLADLLPRLLAPGGFVLLADPLRPQALDWVEQQERIGAWHLTATGTRVSPPKTSLAQDVALFTLRPALQK